MNFEFTCSKEKKRKVSRDEKSVSTRKKQKKKTYLYLNKTVLTDKRKMKCLTENKLQTLLGNKQSPGK